MISQLTFCSDFGDATSATLGPTAGVLALEARVDGDGGDAWAGELGDTIELGCFLKKDMIDGCAGDAAAVVLPMLSLASPTFGTFCEGYEYFQSSFPALKCASLSFPFSIFFFPKLES